MMLGDLISFLSECDPNTKVPLGFHHPHSYRGYYDRLAFEPIIDTTVGNMLIAAKSALGKTYHGYKGGQFKMEEHTDCYLANYGECGEEIGPYLLKYMVGFV